MNKLDQWKLVMEALKITLQKRPDHALVVLDGSALALLGGPENDNVLLLMAPEGTNFNGMTEQELNDIIVATLSK